MLEILKILHFKSNSKNEFLIQLKKVKQLLNNTTKIYLEKTRNNIENVSFLKVGMNIKDARNALIDIDYFFLHLNVLGSRFRVHF